MTKVLAVPTFETSPSSGYEKTKYYYDGINTLLTRRKGVADSSYSPKQVYVLENASISQVIATRTYDGSSYQDYWYCYDLLGNVVARVNSDGYTAENYDMEAFGTVRTGNQEGIHLTTKEYHPEVGLYYFGARWYDAEVGKWLQKEPLGLDGPNLYTYVYNQPGRMVDVTGLEAEVVDVPTLYGKVCHDLCKYLIDTAGMDAYRKCVNDCRRKKVPADEPIPVPLPYLVPKPSPGQHLLKCCKVAGKMVLGTCLLTLDFVLSPGTAHAPPPPQFPPNNHN